MRLFLAVKISNELKEKISQKYLKRIPNELKTVEKENLHITMLFLGEKTEKELGEIRKSIQKIEFAGFKAIASGIGYFSSKVLWIGIEQGSKELGELSSVISKIQKPDKKFHAHITIARNKRMNQEEFFKLAEKLEKEKLEEVFNVNSIVLLKSVLTDKGMVYVEVSERTFSRRASGS